MPNYLVSGNNYNNCGSETSYCRDTSSFFSKLATKLMDMATTINERIEKIKSEVKCSSGGGGVLLASIDAPVMMLAIKQEYMEYIRRYGPPEAGKFDDEKIQIIKSELGITNENTL